jgi:hypothetical protein
MLLAASSAQTRRLHNGGPIDAHASTQEGNDMKRNTSQSEGPRGTGPTETGRRIDEEPTGKAAGGEEEDDDLEEDDEEFDDDEDEEV